MIVHTTDTRALADEFGLDVHPATSTSIGLEEVMGCLDADDHFDLDEGFDNIYCYWV